MSRHPTPSGSKPPIPWYSHPRLTPASPPPPPRPSPQPRTYVNGAYYPNWRIYRQQPPSSLQLHLISHVYYAFAFVRADGTIYLSDDWADTRIAVDGTHGCLRALVAQRAQHPHLKVLLSVGGAGTGSEHFSAVAATPEGRNRFAESARELAGTFGLDGIDVDWEHPSTSQEGVNYLLLLRTLRAHLPPPCILTSALAAGEWALQHIPLAAVSSVLDYIHLMTYDFTGPWVPLCGHHAPLYGSPSAHSTATYVRAQGVPAVQLLLGVPVYGRSFGGCKEVGEVAAPGEQGTYEYSELPREGASEHVDMVVGAAWCVDSEGLVSYDTAQTVRQKAAYVKEQGLGGLFFWTATGDRRGPRGLVEASFTALHTG